MSFVAKDKGGDWHFVGDNMYHCINRNGAIVGKIDGQFLPDPIALWQSKCMQKNISIANAGAELLRPNDVVFKLWEHYNAKSNN